VGGSPESYCHDFRKSEAQSYDRVSSERGSRSYDRRRQPAGVIQIRAAPVRPRTAKSESAGRVLTKIAPAVLKALFNLIATSK
jgi:hypothetical protein